MRRFPFLPPPPNDSHSDNFCHTASAARCSIKKNIYEMGGDDTQPKPTNKQTKNHTHIQKKRRGGGGEETFKQELRSKFLQTPIFIMLLQSPLLADAVFCRINKINVESILYVAFNPNARKIVIM